MTIRWRGKTLWIISLPVDAMGRLCACAPMGAEECETFAALLAGARVYVLREGLEYKQYRKCAPLGVYRRCIALERELREMGVIVVRDGGGKFMGDQKGRASGGPDLSDCAPVRR